MQNLPSRLTALAATLLLCGGLSAQTFEAGLMGGAAVYSGDLSPAEYGVFLEDVSAAGGAYLRFRPTQRLALRVNAVYGRLQARRDRRVRNLNDEVVLVERNFRSKLVEYNLQAEFDLFYLGNPDGNYVAPYLYAGAGVLNFEPEGELDGTYYQLQPLATEGQGLGGPQYASSRYDLSTAIGFLGVGIRGYFGDRITIGLEAGGRFTGTDYLDDVSDTRVNYLDIIGNTGALAARFSNPAVDPADAAEDPNFQFTRGGDANDYYFVGGLTLGISLGGGRGGRGGKTGCYQF